MTESDLVDNHHNQWHVGCRRSTLVTANAEPYITIHNDLHVSEAHKQCRPLLEPQDFTNGLIHLHIQIHCVLSGPPALTNLLLLISSMPGAHPQISQQTRADSPLYSKASKFVGKDSLTNTTWLWSRLQKQLRVCDMFRISGMQAHYSIYNCFWSRATKLAQFVGDYLKPSWNCTINNS